MADGATDDAGKDGLSSFLAGSGVQDGNPSTEANADTLLPELRSADGYVQGDGFLTALLDADDGQNYAAGPALKRARDADFVAGLPSAGAQQEAAAGAGPTVDPYFGTILPDLAAAPSLQPEYPLSAVEEIYTLPSAVSSVGPYPFLVFGEHEKNPELYNYAVYYKQMGKYVKEPSNFPDGFIKKRAISRIDKAAKTVAKVASEKIGPYLKMFGLAKPRDAQFITAGRQPTQAFAFELTQDVLLSDRKELAGILGAKTDPKGILYSSTSRVDKALYGQLRFEEYAMMTLASTKSAESVVTLLGIWNDLRDSETVSGRGSGFGRLVLDYAFQVEI